MSNLKMDKVEQVLIEWIREYVDKAGAEGAVVGLSGGIDSAVTSVLCKKAFGENLLGVIMPCYSNGKDAADARKVADEFDINYIEKDLSPVLDELLLVLEDNKDYRQGNLAVANIKPRLRMTTLYYYAAKYNYLVVGTDNWSELTVGYFTKFGDGGVDIAPLGRLVKTEVRELAKHLGISDDIINKSPSAGLWQGQTDEKEMGVSYDVLDRYILTGEGSAEEIERIETIVIQNKHKLNPLPIPDRDKLE
ncbi:MAG: NAD(+) synthase [Halothermotrichaceae bacterium]